jgi:hypothetical protein
MNAQLMIQPSSFIDAGIQMQPPTCDLAMTVIEGWNHAVRLEITPWSVLDLIVPSYLFMC